MDRRRRALALAWIAGVALVACGKAPNLVHGLPVPPGATVLALGDSLTFGTGTSQDRSYPSVLAGLTGWQVVNAGVPGDTSGQALARLPALLQAHAPKLVLVSIGGNDFLRRQPEAQTRANLRQICEEALRSGAQVMLIAIPHPDFWRAAMTRSLDDHAMYAELAESLKLPLQRRGWSEVLVDERLRSDQIHANAQGYALFANSVARTAREAGLLTGAPPGER